MPRAYEWTNEKTPNFKKMLSESDPKHCTRKPRRSKRNNHCHTGEIGDGAVCLREEYDKVHNSINRYYKVKDKRECNVVVLPCQSADATLEYDKTSARQCARFYVTSKNEKVYSDIVKVSTRNGKLAGRTVVHPDVWENLKDASQYEIPGDVVALLSRYKQQGNIDELDALIRYLRNNGRVCMYFKT